MSSFAIQMLLVAIQHQIGDCVAIELLFATMAGLVAPTELNPIRLLALVAAAVVVLLL